MKRTGLVVLAALAACGGPSANLVVSSRDLGGAGGAPSVKRVVDLGDLSSIPAVGQRLSRARSDGEITVGEMVLVEGEDFGKLPAVNIGGRPTEPLARMGSGAILVRVPPGVPAGDVDVEVSHTRGRGARKVKIIRYGFAVSPGAGAVDVLRFDGAGAPVVRGRIALAGARDVAVSSDGAAAYVAVAAGDGQPAAGLGIISIAAKGGPELTRTLPLSGEDATRVVTAAEAPDGAVLVGSRLFLFHAGNATAPTVESPITLDELGRIASLVMSPQGQTVAVLDGEQNQVVPIAVPARGAPKVGAPVDTMTDVWVPMVQDLGYAPGGEELWIAAGDNAKALVAGNHPAQLVQLSATGAAFAPERVVEMSDVDAPVAVAIARRESVGSATAIRSRARRAAIVVASESRALVAGKTLSAALVAPGGSAQLVSTDLDGRTEPLWRGEALMAAVVLTQDVRAAMALVLQVVRSGDAVTLKRALVWAPLDGSKAQVVPLGGDAAAVDDSARGRGGLALQP